MNNEIRYLDFDITIKEVKGGEYLVLVRSDEGTAETRFTNPFNEDKRRLIRSTLTAAVLRSATGFIRSSSATPEVREMRSFGTQLFEEAINGPVRELYERCSAQSQGVRLRLTLDQSAEDLPWEFLCFNDDFLAFNPASPVVRYIESTQPVRLVKFEYPLRVLIVIAKPTDEIPLETDEEKNSIAAALKPLTDQGLVKLDFIEGPNTWEKMIDALLPNRTHILHFIGHGAFDDNNGEGLLAMADADNQTILVDSERLRVLVQGKSRLALIVLNSCLGSQTDDGQSFSSVAAGLVKSGVPAVIAMQFEISDRSARVISETFYTSMTLNTPVDAALTEARQMVFLGERNSLEWAAPILYTQAPDGRLFELKGRPTTVQPGEPDDVFEEDAATNLETESPFEAESPIEVGERVLMNRYEIVRRIGGSGSGAVYLARDKNLGDVTRAVKEIIQPDLDASQLKSSLAGFTQDARTLTALDHPAIPTIYDYFYDEARHGFYLVMKYIDGQDLLTALRHAPTGKFDEGTVTEWAIQIADALEYLHTQKIIFRDVKPANVMVDSSNRLTLVDLGIARSIYQPREPGGVTAVGTMGYASPELFSGWTDPRSDVYSLGATMFHLLTGSDPQDNPLLIFEFTKNPGPRQLNPQLSTEIEQILTRAVSYKPENRFESAAQMRDVLRTHLDKLRMGSANIPGPERYWFYFSHAREDEDEYLRRFFEDLSERVGRLLGSASQVGYFSSGLEAWSESSQLALQNSSLLVSLFSPKYFASESCGKEWQVFDSRSRSLTAPNVPQSPALILPVLWWPLKDSQLLPPAVRDVKPYSASNDMLGLRLFMHENPKDYVAVVDYLAKTVVKTVESFGTVPPQFAPISISETVNAFAPSAPASPYETESPIPPPPPPPKVSEEERGLHTDALRRYKTELPIEVSEEERPLHNDARRFARLLVSEIKLYDEQKVNEGRRQGNIYHLLRETIDRSREMYNKRVAPSVAARYDYFHHELVNTLAEGDPPKLGPSYPGPTVDLEAPLAQKPSAAVPKSSSKIFISYRREDSAGNAGRLFDTLAKHFGEDRIFMDIDTIEPGENFVEVIENAVGSCAIMLVVMGRQWLNAGGRSSSRLDNPNDFVRLEIATALKRGVRVIPVLVQGAIMPRSKELPADIAPLLRRNAMELSDNRWRYDVDRVVAALESILREVEEKRRAEVERERLAIEDEAEQRTVDRSGRPDARVSHETIRAELKYSCYISFRSEAITASVDEFYESLSSELSLLNRYPAFLDVELPAGEEWLASIEKAIAASACMIVLYTPTYFENTHTAAEYLAMEQIEQVRLGKLDQEQYMPLIMPVVFRGRERLPPYVSNKRMFFDFSDLAAANADLRSTTGYMSSIKRMAVQIDELCRLFQGKPEAFVIPEDFRLPTQEEIKPWMEDVLKGSLTPPFRWLHSDTGIDVAMLNRLSPSSRNALMMAEAVRHKSLAGELYSEHLLAGLYMETDGPTQQLLTTFEDNDTVISNLEKLVFPWGPGEARLEGTTPVPSARLRKVNLSSNALAALNYADGVSEGRSGRGAEIKSRDLLAGLVGARSEESTIAGKWIAEHLGVAQDVLLKAIIHSPDLERAVTLIRRTRFEKFLEKIKREVKTTLEREFVVPSGGPAYFPVGCDLHLSSEDEKVWSGDDLEIIRKGVLEAMGLGGEMGRDFKVDFQFFSTFKRDEFRVQLSFPAIPTVTTVHPPLSRTEALSRIQFIWSGPNDLPQLPVQAVVSPVATSPSPRWIGSEVLAAFESLADESLTSKSFGADQIEVVQLKKEFGDEVIGMPGQVFESRPLGHLILAGLSDSDVGSPKLKANIEKALETAEGLLFNTIALVWYDSEYVISDSDSNLVYFDSDIVGQNFLKALSSHLEEGSGLNRLIVAFKDEKVYRSCLNAFTQMGGQVTPRVLTPFLSQSSRRALALAESLRQRLGRERLSSGHLIWGLYQKITGAAKELLESVATRDQIDLAFQQRLSPTEVLDDLEPAPDWAFASLTLTEGCTKALVRAAAMAGNAKVIRERQLLAGILEVPDANGTSWIAELTGISADKLAEIVAVTEEEEGEPIRPQIERLRESETKIRARPWRLKLSLPDVNEKEIQEVKVGERISVTLDLEEVQGDVPDASDVLLIPENSLELTGYITATGFQLRDNNRFSIQSSNCRPLTDTRTFELTALLSGQRTIEIDLYPGSRTAGLAPASIRRQIRIASPEALPDIKELIDRRRIPNPQPDVMLYVALEETLEGQQTRIFLTCPALGLDRQELDPLPLTEHDLLVLRSNAIRSVAGSTYASPPDTLTALRGCGAMLFDALFSRAFRKYYLAICGAASLSPFHWTWLIISDDNVGIPWELVCAYGEDPDTGEIWYDDFLGDKFALAHWIGRRGLRLFNEAPVASISLVHYDQRANELESWRTALGGPERVEIEDDPANLSRLQPGSDCYGLHVLRYTDEHRSAQIVSIQESESKRQAGRNEVNDMTFEHRLDLTLRRPTIGLSFVTTAAAGKLTGIARHDNQLEANWMMPLIHAGATALVGPRWAVSQEADQVFVREFYRSMREGSQLGEAVWSARREVAVAFPHRPDWLAYTYFGHPNCEPYFVRPAQGFTLFEVVDHPDDAPFRAGVTYEFRASYRTEAPDWFDGRLRMQQEELLVEDLSVMVLPMTGELPKTYDLITTPGSSDMQRTFKLTMPEKATTLPVMVRFQRQQAELRTVMLNLEVKEGF